MGIRLTWTDNNFGEDGHRIYRDTSPMNPLSLPTPLDTVGANVTQYDDGSVVDGTTYYYRVSAYIGATEVVSDEVMIEAVTWLPTDLFDASQVGAWYDPSDLSTMFTDTAGTANVATDGDLVARINDKSGNGFDLIQSTSTLRATYKTDGTKHWLQFDGGDYYNNITTTDIFRNVNSSLIGFAMKSATVVDGEVVCELSNNSGSAARMLVRGNSSTTTLAGGRTLDSDSFNTVSVTGYNVGGSYIVHGDYANGDLDIYFDGVLENENTSFQTPGTTSDTSSAAFALGSKPPGTSPAEFEMYQFVIVGDITTHSATDIANLHAFLNRKATTG